MSIRSKLPPMRHMLFLLGCCMLSAISIGVCVNAYGVFITPVSEALKVGRGAVSLHPTLSSLATGLCCPLAAQLMLKIRLKPLCVMGIIIMCSTTFLMSFSRSVMLFNVLGLIRGAGLTIISMVVLTPAINNWFCKGRSVVTGIAMAMMGLAGAIASPLSAALIERVGYANAYRVLSVIMLALTLPTTLLFVTERPEDVGLTPWGEREQNTAETETAGGFKLKYFSILFIAVTAVVFLGSGVTSLAQHISGYATSVGWSASVGAMLLSCIMIGNIVFKLLMGIISEKIGPFISGTVMLLLSMMGLLIILLLPTSSTLLVIGSVMFGAVYSQCAVGTVNLVHRLYGPVQFSKAYAVATMFGYVGGAVSLTLYGYCYDLTGSYGPSIIVSIAVIAICIGTIALLKVFDNKERSS